MHLDQTMLARIARIATQCGITAALYLVGFTGTADAGCPKGQKRSEHKVLDGETLSAIALDEDVTVKAILRANPRTKPKSIRPGQSLTICTAAKTQRASKKKSSRSRMHGRSCGGGKTIASHAVKTGDSLQKIARRYGVSIDAVVRRNAALKKNRNRLRIGQELLICADRRRSKASASCGYRTPIHRHLVVPGEHAAQIAGRYGVRRRELYRLNSRLKKNPNLVRPGQTLLVCPNIAPRERVKLTHTVQSGENLGAIANRYSLTARELEAFQQGKLTSRNSLRVGQKLVVWRDGALVAGFGAYDDDKGVLKTGVQLPPGQHYVVKHPSLSWGTGRSIRLIQSAVAKYRSRSRGGPKVHVGDISRKGGGKFPPHRSHQHGRDVDIGYVLKGPKKNEKRFIRANAKNIDVARSWKLIKSFLDTDEVKYIFMDRAIQKLLYTHALSTGMSENSLDVYFQYPRRRTHGMIRHSRGHVNHFHVRFFK